jgi:hypothetical protein
MMTNPIFTFISAILLRRTCEPVYFPTGMLKSSFVQGQSELRMKIRCETNTLRVYFTTDLGAGCIDQVTDPIRYNRMMEIVAATCIPDEVYETAFLETVAHVFGGRVRLFIADPLGLTLLDNYGYVQTGPRMRAILEDDVRKFAWNPRAYVRITTRQYSQYRILENVASVLASFADGGHSIGPGRFQGAQLVGFDSATNGGVFFYEDQKIILIGPAMRHSDGKVYPLCFWPQEVPESPEASPKLNVSLPAECPICLNTMISRKTCEILKCGHLFHDTCMHRWRTRCEMQDDRKVTCPTCRSEV